MAISGHKLVSSYSGLVGLLLLLAGCGEPAGKPSLNALRVGNVLGANAASGFAKADAPRPFVFPDDHGPHPQFSSEWWYFTSVLKDASGREFGVQWTLFRQALSSEPLGEGPWLTGQAFMGHFAVSDVARQRHLHAQRLSRGHPALAGARAEPFALWIEDWQVRGETSGSGMVASVQAAQSGEMSIDLELRQTQPVLLQGEAGLSRKGPDQASYYYSMPRLETNGVLTVHDQSFAVSGWTWFDREWSTSVLGDELVGWDWFALQLDDERNIMMFNLRRHDGDRDAFDYAVVTRPGMAPERLGPSDFELTPVAVWRDEEGVQWPVRWQLRIAREGADRQVLDIRALIDDQLMDVGFRYWEGIVQVTGAEGDLGRGYMELTGYGDRSEG